MDTATAEIYTLSLHDALPIFAGRVRARVHGRRRRLELRTLPAGRRRLGDAELALPVQRRAGAPARRVVHRRSEEHTSELQSLAYLVCRLLLEKKKKNIKRAQA